MAALALTRVPIDGGLADLDAAAVPAAGGGDTAPCGPGRFLYVKNAGASGVTVTIATPGTVAGLAVEDLTLTVAASKAGLIPLPRMTAGTGGRAAVTYSGVTSVTVAALELETS